MPNYEYHCSACDKIITEIVPVSERDLFQTCPECGTIGKLKRQVSGASFVYDRIKTIHSRAGNGWKEVCQKIKAGSGKNNTIRIK